MTRPDTTLNYRIRTLSCVLFLGGLIGLIDPLICRGVQPRALLAFIGGGILWAILPYLNWTKDIRGAMFVALVATLIVFQGCFVIYGDPFYVMLGFATPVGAALFTQKLDAAIALLVYSVCSIGTAVCIWCQLWHPPHALEGSDLALNAEQTVTGILVIVAIAVSTMWKERLFAGPTEREQSQQKRFETICENGYDAIFEANKDGEIVFANGSLIGELGFDVEDDVIGAHHLEFLCPSFRSSFLRTVESDRGHYRYDKETRIFDAEQEPHWVRISGGSFRGSDGQLKWVHGVRGIDQQVKQRQQLFEVARIESLGSVCGGLAHDFNNLLTVIGIHAEMISEPRIRTSILDAQEQATDLTAGLLTFSRKQEFREQRIVFADFIKDSVLLVERIAKENVKFSWRIMTEDTMVYIDPGQLQQVIINLVTNCDHAIPAGGQISIFAEKVDVLPDSVAGPSSPFGNSEYVVLRVVDTGQGMGEEVARRAVEPFFTTKPRGRGTGLGLAMVHGVITDAGGMLAIESEESVGTSVSVFLPAIEKSKQSAEVGEPNSEQCSKELPVSVLLVEDQELVGVAIELGLELRGAKVVRVCGAEAAWEQIQNDLEFDVMVTDLILPGMTGMQLIEQAVKNNKKIKSVLISGQHQQDLDFVVNNSEIVRFLAKPFSTNQLIAVIEELIEGEVSDGNCQTRSL